MLSRQRRVTWISSVAKGVLRPPHPAEERLQRGGPRQVLLLDRRQGAGCAVGGPGEGDGQLWLRLGEVGGVDQGEDPRVLVPAGGGDVPLRLEGGDGEGFGRGDVFG